MAKLTVNLEGKGPLALGDSNYMASGGQGVIYRAGNTVIKIYADPKQMDGMRDKIKRLAQLKNPRIAAPEGLVTDSKKRLVGFFMPWVEGIVLSTVFTNAFWQREGFTNDNASTLVDRMRETVAFAHANSCLLIDGNELNWLAQIKAKTDPDACVIDTDSWVVDGKVVGQLVRMPSIMDYHSKSVSSDSDWFAWAIVAFEVYCGIHPYRGTVPGYGIRDLERRMKDNVSILRPGIVLNAQVRPFTSIPGKLKDWFIGVFEHSDRSVPPSPFQKGLGATPSIVVSRTVTTATGALKFEQLLKEPVMRVFPCGVVVTKDFLLDLATRKVIGYDPAPDIEVIRVEDGWLKFAAGKLSYLQEDGAEQELTTMFSGGKVVVTENRMFWLRDGLTEVQFRMLGSKPFASAGPTWSIMANSTSWHQGVGVMDALSAMFLILPFADDSCAQIRVRELDGLKTIDAIAGNRFCTVMAVDPDGQYQKLEFSFNADYTSYKFWQGSAATPELNMAILPKMVVAEIVDDNELVIMVPSTGTTKKIADKHIRTDFQLARWENSVLYVDNKGCLWKVSMS